MDPYLNEEGIRSLKLVLTHVLNSGNFDDLTSSLGLLILAELGDKNYKLVLGNDVTYAMQTFDKLKARMNEVQGSVREDELCLTYMEALNKLRDCYEKNLEESEERELLISKVDRFMFSQESRDPKNSELLYILFLYIAKLDKEKLNAHQLLHSINL